LFDVQFNKLIEPYIISMDIALYTYSMIMDKVIYKYIIYNYLCRYLYIFIFH